MSKLQDKWHDNWLVDTLLRLGFITVLAWIAITIAIYLGSPGEALPALTWETLPEGASTPTPSKE